MSILKMNKNPQGGLNKSGLSISSKKLHKNLISTIIYFGDELSKDKEKKHLAIGYGIDEAYLRPMLVSMNSILRYNNSVLFYVAMDRISSQGKRQLLDFAKRKKVNIIVYLISEKETRYLPIKHKTLSIATYFRFFLFEFIDEDFLLYIDADIICLGDLNNLSYLIGNHIVAAVPDLDRMNRLSKELGLLQNHIYFNAGVLFVNLKKWKKQGLFFYAFDILQKKKDIIRFEDQDVLNILFEGDVSYLPIAYNVLLPHDNRKENTILLHFASQPKPWNKYWQLNPQCVSWTRYLWEKEEKDYFGTCIKFSANKKQIYKWILKRVCYPFLLGYHQSETD